MSTAVAEDREPVVRALRAGGATTGAASSLSAHIHDLVRRGILRGDYPQGSRLAEQRLADELAVSRVPLREALPRLEQAGLVRVQPRRGAVVATWTPQDVDDLVDVRLAVETEAARLAAHRVAAGGDPAPLVAALEASERAVAGGDDLEVAEAAAAFHVAVVAATENPLLLALLAPVSSRLAWLFVLTSSRDARTACTEHRDLVAAVLAGRGDLARALAHAHVERGREPSRETIARQAAQVTGRRTASRAHGDAWAQTPTTPPDPGGPP